MDGSPAETLQRLRWLWPVAIFRRSLGYHEDLREQGPVRGRIEVRSEGAVMPGKENPMLPSSKAQAAGSLRQTLK